MALSIYNNVNAMNAHRVLLGTQGDTWDTQSDMLMALIGSTSAMALLSSLHDRQLAGLVKT